VAFLFEALDTRVRTADGVARRLGLPILAQIPQPPRPLRGAGRLAMVDGPKSIYAEPYRILRTNLDLARLESTAKTFMVTSAVEREGKSTTVANLAVAAAFAGQDVILVDLDLRHPYISSVFPEAGPYGLTDVATGRITLGEALTPIVLEPESHAWTSAHTSSSNGSGHHAGLRVLTTGTPPSNPGEFINSAAVDRILAELSARADIVLIDSAPMLGIGDALTLASKADALLLVTRLNIVRRPMLRELERALTNCKATPIGLVVTGATTDAAYGYAYGYEYVRDDQATPKERRPAADESELLS
jgi:capsular exopolysaccharide synthesis family protein